MRTPIINVMDRAARRAGRALARDFGEVQHLQASKKGAGNFVAAAMRKATETLRYELSKARPQFGFHGDPQQPEGGNRWIVSPLSGSVNFLHGQPHFAMSIAREENGDLIEGAVYDPLRDELFWAVRNTGAYLNDMRLRVSARQHVKDSVIATGMPSAGADGSSRFLATLAAVLPQTAGFRNFGTSALDLAYVAAGRFDGFWQFAQAPEELAAGILLVREAGGFVTDAAGGADMLASGDIIAANDQIHDTLRNSIRGADPGPASE